jgi:excinuclease UvrABC nuclease subunit
VPSERVEFVPERDDAVVVAMPSAPAVFILRGDPGSEPYISKSSDLKRRLIRLLGAPEQGKRTAFSLRERCRSIEYTLTGSDFESGFLLYTILRREFPRGPHNYRERLKLRFAPLIKLNLENPYPRAYVTRRIARLNSASRYYGPFPSRSSAEKFLNDALDFFKMRRCDFDLNPDPSFPGCMYSEMKMCLAPCFKGCSDEEYRREVARVEEFLESSGTSLERELAGQRERASEELQFEAAAAIHARMEKLRGILGATSLPEIARPVDKLSAVMVQPSTQKGAVSLFKITRGMIAAPVRFTVEETAESPAAPDAGVTKKAHPRSMELRIAERLAEVPDLEPSSAIEWNEHIALLKRWYYRSRKTGELFLADERGELPLRRIVRGVGRVLRGEKADAQGTDEAHRAYWLARTREEEV